MGQTLGADLLRSLRKDGEDEEAWATRIEAPEFRPGARHALLKGIATSNKM